MANKTVTIIAALLAVALLANGAFMTFAPESWYWAVPGVPDRGPFNQHFVRDIGFIYLLMGIAFAAGTVYPAQRRLLWLLPAAWLTVHAAFHIWEVIVGICGPESLIEDFAGVTMPAFIAIALVLTSPRLALSGVR